MGARRSATRRRRATLCGRRTPPNGAESTSDEMSMRGRSERCTVIWCACVCVRVSVRGVTQPRTHTHAHTHGHGHGQGCIFKPFCCEPVRRLRRRRGDDGSKRRRDEEAAQCSVGIARHVTCVRVCSVCDACDACAARVMRVMRCAAKASACVRSPASEYRFGP